MKINDIVYGWLVTDATPVDEISAILHILEHKKSGARLCYLERDDACKTFAVTFPTIPTDDTGVFHILEHSVLCGSRKFPLKEPFTELLKGSLNTFLNAMTYNDKTAYPVSSRNDKDFYNLVDVYMDAVFHPTAVACENIFRQEGWRYELTDDGRLEYNGVVYSEMRGAYSSVDELADHHLARLVFPNGTYSYDSGGHPDAIPTLTYEGFCAAHKKFYRPENAYMFLDGRPDLDDILPLLNSYLDEYERGEFRAEITEGDCIITDPLTVEYEIEAGEDETDKTRVYLAYRAGECTDTVRAAALSAITDALADSNEAPLKKKILSSGLCDNVYVYAPTGNKWNTLNIEFRGVKDGREEDLIHHFDSVIEETLNGGIDKSLIAASVDLAEFRAREADYGSYPKGIVYLSAVTEAWLYGMHPSELLRYEPIYAALRERLKNDYYTSLFGEVLGGARATLIMHPSKTLASKRAAALAEKLDTHLGLMSECEREQLKGAIEQFNLWQAAPDTAEALATLPSLTVADLGDMPKEIPTNVDKYRGATIISHPIATNGITYAQIYFDATDTAPEDISPLVFMGFLYSNLDTLRGSANDFRRRSKSDLGSITLTYHATESANEPKLYALLQFSCLDTKRESAIRLAQEYLYETVLENRDATRRMLTQLAATLSDSITGAGHSYAVTRCAARYSRLEALKEHIVGYEFYRWVKRYTSASDSLIDGLIEKMRTLRDKIMTRPRTTAAATSKEDGGFLHRCVDMIKSGDGVSKPSLIEVMPKKNEGIAVPSQVSYAALGSNLYAAGYRYHTGAWSTLATLLNYQILWEEVRVKGGAYGTGFISRANSGTTAFYSYRDPNPSCALDVFRTAKERIQKTLKASTDLTKFIIGTVGMLDEVTTPAADGNTATVLYLAKKTHDDVLRARQEVISADSKTLSDLADMLDKITSIATVTVVGPREKLAEMGLDEILDI